MAWALVKDGNVTTMYNRPKAITLDGIQHPANIFTVWNKATKKAHGIYDYNEVNKNVDSKYYTLGAYSMVVDDAAGTVTKTWEHKEKDLDAVKEQLVAQTKQQAGGTLSSTDWMVIRAAEGGTAVPADVAWHRAAVRTHSNDVEAGINAAADVAALKAHMDGVSAWPTLEDYVDPAAAPEPAPEPEPEPTPEPTANTA